MSVAVIVKGYPRLSETFVAQEILALEQAGLDQRIISLRHPTDERRHAMHDAIRAPVSYLPEYLYQEPLRVFRAWRRVRRRPAYREARRTWLRDLRRDRTANRGRRFGQALVLAAELPGDVTHLHVHFLHTPGSVARYAALLTGLPWSVSAHAKDIWTIPEWEKAEKLASCDWLVTCTAVGAEHLAEIARRHGVDSVKVALVYHGLDLRRFPPPPQRPPRDGSRADDPVIVLSVGRAVEKKGHDDLLAALAGLPPELSWRFVHVGTGPLRQSLRAQAEALGIADRVEWLGALPQDDVIAQYRRADLFALASRIAADGDRDGLPNVLMEAQTQGLPCLSTRVSAMPELIEDGTTGLLVSPGDRPALGRALAALIADPALRERLGRAGSARVRARFTFDAGIRRLAERFGLPAPAVASPAALQAG
jgi:glycosyltransferase involved in cell wall biosynthesis